MINDPYTATLGGFSKVTNLFRVGLQLSGIDMRPTDEKAGIDLDNNAQIEGMSVNNQQESGFEVITKVCDIKSKGGKIPKSTFIYWRHTFFLIDALC